MLGDFSLGAAVKAGGAVMYLLILCSVLSIAVIFDRLFCYYARSRFSRADFMQAIRSELAKGDIKKALAICQDIPAPFAAVVAAALKASHLEEKEICAAMEREIIIETHKLEKRTAIVGTIGSTAVYIGLLGTVWGIIKAFKDISLAGSGGINVVTSGIAEALVCTGMGLIVAIPAVAAYNYFVNRINEFVSDMELCESEITGLIKRAGKG